MPAPTVHYKLEVNNCHSNDEWWFLANDEELNHVPPADAGVFTAKQIISTIDYIYLYGDTDSQFRVHPVLVKKDKSHA